MNKVFLSLTLLVFVFACAKKTVEKSELKEITSAEITGQATKPNCPSWTDHAVFYQIYPQTFYDSNGDGIGDLQGIIKKLDYVKSLGVDGIWLNPFFESTFLDAGYDVTNYYKVAPRYGTNEDAKTLFDEAHKRGLKVIFDYVVSYTSIDHPWFRASAEQKPNKYSNWYIWTDNIWLNPPKEYADAFVKGFGTRNGQYMRNFYYCQPALNFGFAKPDTSYKWQLPVNHPDILALGAELKNMLQFWMDMGADGFRADMAGALVKTANISGNEQFFNTHEDGTKQFWSEIRDIFNQKYNEAFMISEWSHPVSAIDAGFHADFFHWFDGYNDLFQKESWRILNGYSEGHSYFDQEGKGNIMFFLKNYMNQYNQSKGKGYISLPLGNHDNARLGNKRTDDDLEIIYAFGLTMPGLTFVYYGNEIGMRQLATDWPQVEGAYRPRNGARTPMQWTSGKNLGFSQASAEKLYLPVDTSKNAPNVETQQNDSNSLLNRTRRLIKLKHDQPALAAYAEFVPVYAKSNEYPFIYARAMGNDIVLCVFNPSGKAVKADFKLNVNAKSLNLLAGKPVKSTIENGNYSLEIPEVTYAILKVVQ